MIANLQPYPEYKESGLPWLGRMPRHWDLKRGKSIFQRIDKRSVDGKEELLTVSSALGVVPRRTASVTMFKAESYRGYKLCWPGDLVINSLWAWGRGLGVSKHHGIISSAYGVYRIREGAPVSPAFIHEIVRSMPFNWELQVRSKGIWISRLQLTDESFLDAPFYLPPPEEQAAMVRFLDYANGRLERAIRAKRKVIALLHEQKQAIIHRAVTRGLDPTVPIKPSGIPWLGDIPEHWRTNRLKALVTESVAGPYGSSLTKAMYVQQGYRVYGQQQVIPDDFKIGDYYISPDKFSEMRRYQVFADDVLVSVMGTVGRVAVVPIDAEPGIINPRLVRYRPDFTRVRSRFLQLAMQAPPSRVQLLEGSKGTTMEGLNMAILGRLVVVVPPLAEQDSILGYVRSETSTLNTVIKRLEREIELLREYRTRLVADVVTGKLDVRPAARHLPAEPLAPDLEELTEPEEAEA